MFQNHRLKWLLIGCVALVGVVFYQTVGLTIDPPNETRPTTESTTSKSDEASSTAEPTIKVETRSYTSVQQLDKELGSTGFMSTTKNGTRFVVVKQFPKDFDQIRSADRKKRLFRQILLPQIRLENRRLLNQRRQLKSYLKEFRSASDLTDTARTRIRTLLTRYEVVDSDRNNREITQSHLTSLRRRIQLIPPSLVLAQAANESAWGTSRFCLKANNIFGEWTYNKSEGLKPKGVDESASHRVKIFTDIRASLRSYMLNLNTHSAYEPFRQLRVEHGKTMNSLKLVKGLKNYSSRRGEYVESIANLIRYNDYRQYDRF